MSVPRRGIEAKLAGVHQAEGLPGVDSQMNRCWGNRGPKLHVIHIKNRLGFARVALNPKAGEVLLVGQTEGGERNGDLLPGIGGQRGQRVRRLVRAIKQTRNLDLLPANASVDPKTQTCVRRGIEVRTVQNQCLITGIFDTDRIDPGMRWGIEAFQIDRGPTPVLEAIDKMVRIDRKIGLRQTRA